MNYGLTYRAETVLVTGASGFIGSHLCQHLIECGATVNGTYLNLPQSIDGMQWHQVDLCDQLAVQQLIQQLQPAYIFHLASCVSGRRDADMVLTTFDNNLRTTVNLLSAAQTVASCKKIILSNSQEEPQSSEANNIPCSPYAAAKYAASTYARMYHALYGLPVAIARIFMVYGPGQRDIKKLVPYTIMQSLNNQSPLISSGERKIDWIYIDDLVQGLLQLGLAHGLAGKTIDFGSGQFHSIAQVVEQIVQQINPLLQVQFGALPVRAMEKQVLARADDTHKQLNWRAKVSLSQGLAATIDWYRRKQQERC